MRKNDKFYDVLKNKIGKTIEIFFLNTENSFHSETKDLLITSDKFSDYFTELSDLEFEKYLGTKL